MPNTTLGITYPASTDDVRPHEDMQELAGDVDTLIAADRTKRDVASSTYTPVITGSTSGTWSAGASVISARYIQIGRIVYVWVDITLGTSVSISGSTTGTMIISLPVTAARVTPAHCGTGFISEGSGGRWNTSVQLNTTSNCIMVLDASGSPAVTGVLVSNQTPNGNVWAATDVIRFQAIYEAASAA